MKVDTKWLKMFLVNTNTLDTAAYPTTVKKVKVFVGKVSNINAITISILSS